MDPEAERRARAKRMVSDLARATTDEEACPPEWTDIGIEVRQRTAKLRESVEAEADLFASTPDVRVALARRERMAEGLRREVAYINAKVRRLNMIAPLPRFQRPEIDEEEILRPLYRTRRLTG